MRFLNGLMISGALGLLVPGVSGGADRSTLHGVSLSTAIADFDELDASILMIESEFDPALLESLPPPTLPPAQVNLPKAIIQKGQWKGSLCGITRLARVVFRKPADWEKFWTLAIAPYSPGMEKTPDVDFSKNIVVGVFEGEKPYPRYGIEIRSTKAEMEEGSQVLVVRYRNSQKMQAVFSPPFAVQPFHLMKVPAFEGRVTFRKIPR